jgi:5-deoxy-glucuronate isomerase
MTQNLLIRPHVPDGGGCILSVTPESAGWRYVGFEVFRLEPGMRLARETAGREACLVVLTGRASIEAAGRRFGSLGERMSVFAGKPAAVYVPAQAAWSVAAETPLQLAVCTAPAEGRLPARLIAADEIGTEDRGAGTNARHVRNVLPQDAPAESLLVVEVITPGGNWSSYPPHKHDSDALPEESRLEEIYYHRIDPPQGFAFQRVYTDDRSLDQTMSVEDGDCVLVPRGYHPVGAPHGYDLYYLNVMAGPQRRWSFRNDPAHAWILKA